MATLVLGAAATAFSGAIGAGTFTSALISGAATIAGAYTDNLLISALSPARNTSVTGPRIGDLRLQTSTEGAPLPDAFGRLRLAGQVIWATRLRMETASSTQKVGGKGLGGGQKVTTTQHLYYANFAIGLCEGPITGIGRVWADGKLLDRSGINHRVYRGTDDQQPDPLIMAKEGSAPAYRGTAYIVFEDLALEDFGNRLPQLEFEVFRRLGGVEDDVEGMVVIPGAGEWVYADEPVRKSDPETEGISEAENSNNQVGGTDWQVALDNLELTCPNVRSVLLVVAWFGTDLRCGSCEIRPGVEFGSGKETTPLTWSVHSETRATAHEVSRDPADSTRPVYGGTPSDQSVVQAIRDLKARGFEVVLYPFILMDVPPGNGLADPYGGAEQAVFPWRGRITCDPAPGEPGTVDKTAAAGPQVESFFGSAAPGDISLSVDAETDAVTCSYSGPAEWSLRRMVLHYARLCEALNQIDPGAVRGFAIGSELVGLTRLRSSAKAYPAVSQLVSLAADCKSVLGGSVAVTYAADWSEYRGHYPGDGTGDFFFHLDPLWSSASIDAIAIDNYMKLSDWREGRTHLDFLAGHKSIYSKSYLAGNVEGGEDYDWYYASAADRDSQTRTPISDGLAIPERDLTATHVFPRGILPGGVVDSSKDTVFACSIRLPVSPVDACLFELGGDFMGIWAGLRDGGTTFRVRGGDGQAALAASDGNTVVLNVPVATLPMDGELHTVVIEIRPAAGRCRMWLDGALKGEAFTSDLSPLLGSAWAGGDIGAYLDGSLSSVVTGEPITAWPVPEDASDLVVYGNGQTISDAPGLDGLGEDWLFRQKDFLGWWQSAHHDRPGGVRFATPTAWQPQSKPVWFTEYGFPSVDKATNQPNVFVDPKSSESNWPHYSNRDRDDLIQRRGVQTLLDYWDPASGNNPVSAVYGAPMLDLARCHLWTWDARPYPSFPHFLNVWSDGANWDLGHWVAGKFGVVELADLIIHICAEVGFTAIDVSLLEATVTGWLRPDLASPRDQIDVLAQLFRFDAVESEGVIRFIPRGLAPVGAIDGTGLAAPDRNAPDWSITRAQETDLPVRALITYWDGESDYRQTSSAAGRLVATSARVTRLSAPVVIEPGQAGAMAEAWLYGEWAAREQAGFALPPSLIRFDPADVVTVEIAGRNRDMRLGRIVDGGARHCEAVSVETTPSRPARGRREPPAPPPPIPSYGEAVLEVLDLPVLSDAQAVHRPWLAGFAGPWADVTVLEGSRVVGLISAQATLGATTTDLPSGTPYRFDLANSLTVRLAHGSLASVSEATLLEGSGNALAVRNGDGDWEILQFAEAELIGTNTWRLAALLRGRRGTEHAMRDPVASGARVVLLNEALVQADVPLSDRGIARTWEYGPSPLPVTDTAFKARLTTFEAVALMPFAPVHLTGTRNGSGDLAVNWIRRTRSNGAWANGSDVPLGEAFEAYDMEVLNGAAVVRTVAGLTGPAYTYTAVEQIADFGSVQSSIEVRVFQISDEVGRGVPAEKTL